MKKKLIIILSVVFVCFALLFVCYKVSSINQTSDTILTITKALMDNISAEDYDGMKLYLKKSDGTDLTQNEINNFLLNTGLYRTQCITDEKPTFTYSTSIDFFNTDNGSITFSYTALDGDVITNSLNYTNTGKRNHLIATDIQERAKEKETFTIATDLANGTEIGYKGKKDNESENIKVYHFVKDENGNVGIEIYKEAKNDFLIALTNSINEDVASLKKLNKDYDIKWNDDYSVFSVYYNESVEKKLLAREMRVNMKFCSILKQALNGNPDWHLTINFYDYSTEKLIKTETIR